MGKQHYIPKYKLRDIRNEKSIGKANKKGLHSSFS